MSRAGLGFSTPLRSRDVPGTVCSMQTPAWSSAGAVAPATRRVRGPPSAWTRTFLGTGGSRPHHVSGSRTETRTHRRRASRGDLLAVSRRLGAGWLTAGGKISRETTKNHGQRWKSHDVSLRYAAEIGRGWSLSVRTGLIRTRFDAEDRLFLKRRGDQTRDVGISVSHRALAMGGYLPELTLNACPRSSWYTNISSVLLPH